MAWLKGNTGVSLSEKLTLNQNLKRVFSGSRVNSKRVKVDFDTINWSAVQPKSYDWAELKKYLGIPLTVNYPDLPLLTTMYGKKTPVLKVPDSNWEVDLGSATAPKTGMQYGIQPETEIYNLSQQTFEWCITAQSELSLQTLHNLLLWNDLVWYSGALLELVNPEELGLKQDSWLILRIPEPSFGVVMEVKNTLLLMNSEEESISHIYSDGWIVTRSSWRLKEPLSSYALPSFGSPPTSIPNVGTHY